MKTILTPLWGHTITDTAGSPIAVTLVGFAGPTGPQGPPGAGGAYVHTQAIAAAVWVVNHNLGFRPAVAVLSPGGLEVIADIVHITTNQTEIRFNSPASGTARFT